MKSDDVLALLKSTHIKPSAMPSRVLRGMHPYAVDALRGTIHGLKWRGTLSDYADTVASSDMSDLIDATIERLRWMSRTPDYDDIVNPDSDDLPLKGMGLGTYGWKYNTDIINIALDTGIVLLDTAESYGFGRVEKALADARIDIDKPNFILATKVASNHMGYTATQNAIARSMVNMRVDRLPLYQIHRPPEEITITAHALAAITDMYDAGIVEHIGVSNFSIDQLVFAQLIIPKYKIVSVQVRYNLQDRGIERALLPWCQSRGMLIIAYSPLGQNWSKFKERMSKDQYNALNHVAIRNQAGLVQVVLAWLLHKGVIPIPRTNDIGHLMEIMDARELLLDNSDIGILEHAFPIME